MTWEETGISRRNKPRYPKPIRVIYLGPDKWQRKERTPQLVALVWLLIEHFSRWTAAGWKHAIVTTASKTEREDSCKLNNWTDLQKNKKPSCRWDSQPYCLTAPFRVTWRHQSPVTWPFDFRYVISYWWFFATKALSLSVSEILKGESDAVVDMNFIRPLNRGQGHSFWYQSISHVRLPIGCQ